MKHLITDSQDEQAFEDLVRDADQVHVPVFQRSYVWKKRELDQLENDIRLIQDNVENSQFIGAVVAYERPRDNEIIGRMRAIAVVDGQQRLLTLYIFIMAIVKQMYRLDADLAAETLKQFLVIPIRRGMETNTRVVPSHSDRAQFAQIWRGLIEDFGDQLGDFTPKPPVVLGGDEAGALLQQYNRITKLITKSDDASTQLESLRSWLDIVTTKLTFVSLKLNDPSVATKIFERLNYAGVRVGIIDLVRNELFSRIDDPQEAMSAYNEVWVPFERTLGDKADGLFFPYCLLHNPNIKKSELFAELRGVWREFKTPRAIVEHLTPFKDAYLALADGRALGVPVSIGVRVARMNRMSCPAAVYPLLIKLLLELKSGGVSEQMAAGLFDALESFLVRRAVVGYEPTGLHALFKSVWNEIRADPSAVAFKEAAARRSTIQWPNDQSFGEAIRSRNLAKANICGYLLCELDRVHIGDNPANDPTIEHVLPQTLSSDSSWAQAFNEDQHKKLVHTLANLVPLSGELNYSIQDVPFHVKRDRFRRESMYSTPRHLAERYEEWTPETLGKRAEEVVEMAITRWAF